MPRRYDWRAIRAYYDAGHSVTECKAIFGFSNGAWVHAVARGQVVPRRRPPSKPAGVTRAAVEQLTEEGLSLGEIAARLRITKPTVCYHRRKLELPPDRRFCKRYDWSEIQKAHDSGLSVSGCMERFGFSRASWTLAVGRGVLIPRPRAIPIDDLLVAGRLRNRNHVKSRLLGAGLKQRRCERCGLDTWMDAPIGLELHHVNGDGLDNRLENLQLLCGNCHSQTANWGGKARQLRAAARKLRAA